MIPLYDFITALKFVNHAAGKKDVRFALNGVHLQGGPNKLTLTATDGHRAARIVLDVETGLAAERGHIICNDAVKALLSILKPKRTDPRSLTLVEVKNGDLVAKWEGGELALLCEAGIFPNVDRILPSTAPTGAPLVGLNAKYLAEAGAALAIVANPKYHGMKLESWDANTVIRLEAPTNHGDFKTISEPAVAFIMPMRL